MAKRGRRFSWPVWLSGQPNRRRVKVAVAAAMLGVAAGTGVVTGGAPWPLLLAVTAFTAVGTILVTEAPHNTLPPVSDLPALDPLAAVAPPPRPDLPKPRMLPERQVAFRGRAEELAQLLHHHATGRAQRDARPIDDPGAAGAQLITLHGRPGVGKTALADEFAHRIADQYPDGQLYATLGSAGHPRPPGEVLKVFLAALGRTEGLPRRTEDRLKMFRSLLVGRRVLVVLDAARNADQVRQLLPTAPGCTVIVTSRRDLGLSLYARGASIPVDVPSAVEAAEILRTAARTSPYEQPVCTAEIVHFVGRLPLALRAAGEQAAEGGQQLCGMARTLRNEQGRLAQLQFRGLDVRGRIASEYRKLTDREKEAFHLLAMVESATFQPWVLAALIHVDVLEAENLVAQLCAAQLVDVAHQDSSGPARYHFHPLVRIYAREQLADRVQAREQRAARDRLHEAHLQVVRGSGGGLRYVAAEYASLIDAIDTAAAHGDWAACWWIGSLLGDCVPYDLDPERCLRAFKTCAEAAEQLGDEDARVAVAVARGSYLVSIERYDEGIAALEEVTQQPGGEELIIRAHRRISEAYLQAAAYADARRSLERTAKLIRRTTDAHADPYVATELAMIKVLKAEMQAATDATRWRTDRPYQDVQAAHDDRVRYRIQVNLSEVASRRRDWSAALDHLGLASLAERENARRAASVAYRTARVKLAAARHLRGDEGDRLAQEAVDLAAEAVLTFRRINNEVGEIRARCMLARALTRGHQLEEAGAQIRLASQALPDIRGAACAIGPLEARIKRAEGELLIDQGSYAAAIGVLRRAEQLFDDNRDVLSRAETRRLLGRAYRQINHISEAADMLWYAADEYRRAGDHVTFGEICAEIAAIVGR